MHIILKLMQLSDIVIQDVSWRESVACQVNHCPQNCSDRFVCANRSWPLLTYILSFFSPMYLLFTHLSCFGPYTDDRRVVSANGPELVPEISILKVF